MFLFQINTGPSQLKSGEEAKILSGLPLKILKTESLRQAALPKPEPLSLRKSRKQAGTQDELLRSASDLYKDLLLITREDPTLSKLKKSDQHGYDSVTQALALCRVVSSEFESYAPGFVKGSSTVSPAQLRIYGGTELDILRHELKYLRSQPASPQVSMDQPIQKAQVQPTAQALSEQVRALEKKVFEDYLAGKPISGEAAAMARQLYQDAQRSTGEEKEKAAGLLRQLNDGLSLNFQLPDSSYDSHYQNFFAILESGFVQADGKKEFFLKNLPAFRKLVELVDDAQSAGSGLSKSIAFEFRTRQEAALFERGLAGLAVMRFEPEKGTEHGIVQGSQVFFTFAYVAPQAVVFPAPEQIKPSAPSLQPVPTGAYGRTEARDAERKESSVESPAFAADRRASSSGPVPINYRSSQQVMYARNFNPENPLALQMVRSMAKAQLALFCADKGVKLEGMSQKERAQLLSEMKIQGSATCESPAQYGKNLSLAQKRAEMLAKEIILQVMGPKAKVAEYLPSMALEARVVSPWEIKGKVAKEEAAAALSSLMGAAREGTAFHAGILYSILTGDYKRAGELARANVSDKKEQKGLLDLVSSVEKKQGKDSPAITQKDKGAYEITNQKLAEALWLSQGATGLRFESVRSEGGRARIAEPATEKEKLGVLFTSLLEANYSRSASLQRKEQAVLSISMGDPGGFYAPGRKISIPLQVSYELGGKPGVFSAGGGKVSATVTVSRGMGEIPCEVKGGEGGRYILSFTAPQSGEVKISAEAVKPDLGISSGRVGASIHALPAPRLQMVPEYPRQSLQVAFPPTFSPSDLVVPPPFDVTATTSFGLVASSLPNFMALNKEIDNALRKLGGIWNDGGYSLPNLSREKFVSLNSELGVAFASWLATTDPATGRQVRAIVAQQINGSIGDFENALKQGNVAGAFAMFKEGSKFKEAFGTFRNTLSGIATAFAGLSAQKLQGEGLQLGLATNINLIGGKTKAESRLDLYLYYNAKYNSFQLSLEKPEDFLVHNAGFDIVYAMENASVWAGAGATMQGRGKEIPPRLYVKVGGQVGMGLSEAISVGLQMNYLGLAGAGVKERQEETFSLAYSPKRADFVDLRLGATAEAGELPGNLGRMLVTLFSGSTVDLRGERLPTQFSENAFAGLKTDVETAIWGLPVTFSATVSAGKHLKPTIGGGIKIKF